MKSLQLHKHFDSTSCSPKIQGDLFSELNKILGPKTMSDFIEHEKNHGTQRFVRFPTTPDRIARFEDKAWRALLIQYRDSKYGFLDIHLATTYSNEDLYTILHDPLSEKIKEYDFVDLLRIYNLLRSTEKETYGRILGELINFIILQMHFTKIAKRISNKNVYSIDNKEKRTVANLSFNNFGYYGVCNRAKDRFDYSIQNKGGIIIQCPGKKYYCKIDTSEKTCLDLKEHTYGGMSDLGYMYLYAAIYEDERVFGYIPEIVEENGCKTLHCPHPIHFLDIGNNLNRATHDEDEITTMVKQRKKDIHR